MQEGLTGAGARMLRLACFAAVDRPLAQLQGVHLAAHMTASKSAAWIVRCRTYWGKGPQAEMPLSYTAAISAPEHSAPPTLCHHAKTIGAYP
jgi:hypothetical protein